MQNTKQQFEKGDTVAVIKSQSHFRGWIGVVKDVRTNRILGPVVAVDFNNPSFGKFEGVVFSTTEVERN